MKHLEWKTQSFVLLFTGIYRPRWIGCGPIIHSVFSVWHNIDRFFFHSIFFWMPCHCFEEKRLVKGVKPICCRLANTVCSATFVLPMCLWCKKFGKASASFTWFQKVQHMFSSNHVRYSRDIHCFWSKGHLRAQYLVRVLQI